jgi:amino-acid N-acetyltransferase
MEIKGANNYRETIVAMLNAEKLPVNDLPSTLDNFLVALQKDKVIGVAGVEVYGDHGLLRSLVVHPAYQGKGIAGQLVSSIESLALSKGLGNIYLLTETAPDYFARKNYDRITRAEVPAEVQASSEFSFVCPQSAIVMKKTLSK